MRTLIRRWIALAILPMFTTCCLFPVPVPVDDDHHDGHERHEEREHHEHH